MHFKTVTRAALAVALLLLASTSAKAEDLRWKFKTGETLDYVLSRSVEGNINLGGSEIAFTLQMVFDTNWKPTAVAEDGTADVDLTVDRIQIAMDSPLFGRMAYDSTNPKEPEGPVWAQMKPTMTNMLGAPFKAKISSLGEVTDIELPAKLAEALGKQEIGENRRQGFGIGGNSFNEKGIKELLTKSVLPLPEKAGDDVTWMQTFENVMPSIGKQTTETTFSVAGTEEQDGQQVAKITAETELLFEPDENPRADLEIVEQAAEATYYFDPKAGHMTKADGTQEMTMELSGQQELTQKVKETMSMRQGKSPADKSVTDSKESGEKKAEAEAK